MTASTIALDEPTETAAQTAIRAKIAKLEDDAIANRIKAIGRAVKTRQERQAETVIAVKRS